MKGSSLRWIILVVFLALALMPAHAVAAKKHMLTFATASPGGALMMGSSVWAGFLMKKIPDLNITVESTGGGTANIRLIQAREADIGWASCSNLYMARRGLDWAKGRKYTRPRYLLPWFRGATEIWTLGNLKLNSIQDLNGKIVTPGPSAGPADGITRLMIEFFGIKPKKFINASWGDAIGQQKDGLIDVAVISTISPWPALKNLDLTHKVNLLYLTDEQLKSFFKKYPYYLPGKTKAGSYKHQEKEGHSVGFFSAVLVSPEFDADLAYKILNVTFEGREELKGIMGVYGKQLDASLIEFANQIPIHPGAIRYYKERGYKIPKTLE